MEIIPAILTNNPEELKDLIAKAEGVGRVQIDIIDGVYADNKTIDPVALRVVDTKLQIDFHLMTDSPIDWVAKCVDVGADRIIGHIEKMGDQIEFIDRVHASGAKAGLAIDLATPVGHLQSLVLPRVDVILVLSVSAGFGGQQFNLQSFDKMKELNQIRQEENYHFKICVDGGVTRELIHDMEKLGVDEVAVGKRVFEGDVKDNIKNLQI